eukprot:1161316-Pelagomonas_calceolata.AAC.1
MHQLQPCLGLRTPCGSPIPPTYHLGLVDGGPYPIATFQAQALGLAAAACSQLAATALADRLPPGWGVGGDSSGCSRQVQGVLHPALPLGVHAAADGTGGGADGSLAAGTAAGSGETCAAGGAGAFCDSVPGTTPGGWNP